MSFNHQIVELPEGDQIDVQLDKVDTFFLFTPEKRMAKDNDYATDVFEEMMQFAFEDFWDSFSENYERYNLLTIYSSKVTFKEATDAEMKRIVTGLFGNLIKSRRFTEDHSMILGFPSFEMKASSKMMTVCLGMTYKSLNRKIYLFNHANSVRPI